MPAKLEPLTLAQRIARRARRQPNRVMLTSHIELYVLPVIEFVEREMALKGDDVTVDVPCAHRASCYSLQDQFRVGIVKRDAERKMWIYRADGRELLTAAYADLEANLYLLKQLEQPLAIAS